MPRSGGEKLKILLIRDFFERFTDKDHPITVPEIISRLEKEEIYAERRAIYRDLATFEHVLECLVFGRSLRLCLARKIPRHFDGAVLEIDGVTVLHN